VSSVRVVARVELSDGDVQRLMTGQNGPVFQAMRRAGTTTVARAKSELTADGRIDTGVLRNSIESETFLRGREVVSRVGTDVFYSRYVHEGTNGPIVPRTQRVLRFKPKGGSAFVFAPQVKGTKETGSFTPFLLNALKQLSFNDLT